MNLILPLFLLFCLLNVNALDCLDRCSSAFDNNSTFSYTFYCDQGTTYVESFDSLDCTGNDTSVLVYANGTCDCADMAFVSYQVYDDGNCSSIPNYVAINEYIDISDPRTCDVINSYESGCNSLGNSSLFIANVEGCENVSISNIKYIGACNSSSTCGTFNFGNLTISSHADCGKDGKLYIKEFSSKDCSGEPDSVFDIHETCDCGEAITLTYDLYENSQCAGTPYITAVDRPFDGDDCEIFSFLYPVGACVFVTDGTWVQMLEINNCNVNTTFGFVGACDPTCGTGSIGNFTYSTKLDCANDGKLYIQEFNTTNCTGGYSLTEVHESCDCSEGASFDYEVYSNPSCSGIPERFGANNHIDDDDCVLYQTFFPVGSCIQYAANIWFKIASYNDCPAPVNSTELSCYDTCGSFTTPNGTLSTQVDCTANGTLIINEYLGAGCSGDPMFSSFVHSNCDCDEVAVLDYNVYSNPSCSGVPDFVATDYHFDADICPLLNVFYPEGDCVAIGNGTWLKMMDSSDCDDRSLIFSTTSSFGCDDTCGVVSTDNGTVSLKAECSGGSLYIRNYRGDSCAGPPLYSEYVHWNCDCDQVVSMDYNIYDNPSCKGIPDVVGRDHYIDAGSCPFLTIVYPIGDCVKIGNGSFVKMLDIDNCPDQFSTTDFGPIYTGECSGTCGNYLGTNFSLSTEVDCTTDGRLYIKNYASSDCTGEIYFDEYTHYDCDCDEAAALDYHIYDNPTCTGVPEVVATDFHFDADLCFAFSIFYPIGDCVPVFNNTYVKMIDMENCANRTGFGGFSTTSFGCESTCGYISTLNFSVSTKAECSDGSLYINQYIGQGCFGEPIYSEYTHYTCDCDEVATLDYNMYDNPSCTGRPEAFARDYHIDADTCSFLEFIYPIGECVKLGNSSWLKVLDVDCEDTGFATTAFNVDLIDTCNNTCGYISLGNFTLSNQVGCGSDGNLYVSYYNGFGCVGEPYYLEYTHYTCDCDESVTLDYKIFTNPTCTGEPSYIAENRPFDGDNCEDFEDLYPIGKCVLLDDGLWIKMISMKGCNEELDPDSFLEQCDTYCIGHTSGVSSSSFSSLLDGLAIPQNAYSAGLVCDNGEMHAFFYQDVECSGTLITTETAFDSSCNECRGTTIGSAIKWYDGDCTGDYELFGTNWMYDDCISEYGVSEGVICSADSIKVEQYDDENCNGNIMYSDMLERELNCVNSTSEHIYCDGLVAHKPTQYEEVFKWQMCDDYCYGRSIGFNESRFAEWTDATAYYSIALKCETAGAMVYLFTDTMCQGQVLGEYLLDAEEYPDRCETLCDSESTIGIADVYYEGWSCTGEYQYEALYYTYDDDCKEIDDEVTKGSAVLDCSDDTIEYVLYDSSDCSGPVAERGSLYNRSDEYCWLGYEEDLVCDPLLIGNSISTNLASFMVDPSCTDTCGTAYFSNADASDPDEISAKISCIDGDMYWYAYYDQAACVGEPTNATYLGACDCSDVAIIELDVYEQNDCKGNVVSQYDKVPVPLGQIAGAFIGGGTCEAISRLAKFAGCTNTDYGSYKLSVTCFEDPPSDDLMQCIDGGACMGSSNGLDMTMISGVTSIPSNAESVSIQCSGDSSAIYEYYDDTTCSGSLLNSVTINEVLDCNSCDSIDNNMETFNVKAYTYTNVDCTGAYEYYEFDVAFDTRCDGDGLWKCESNTLTYEWHKNRKCNGKADDSDVVLQSVLCDDGMSVEVYCASDQIPTNTQSGPVDNNGKSANNGDGEDKNSTGATVGIVIAIIVVLILVGALIYWKYRQTKMLGYVTQEEDFEEIDDGGLQEDVALPTDYQAPSTVDNGE